MLIDKIERLMYLLEYDVIQSTANVVAFTDDLKLDNRKEEIDRAIEIEVLEETKDLEQEDKDEVLEKLYEIEDEIKDLLEINPKLLVTEELLDVNGLVHEYNKSKGRFTLSKEIYEDMKNENTENNLRCWNVETQRYEGLEYDKEDFDRLKDLNIVKKPYDEFTHKLYFFDSDLHLRPLDNFLLENSDFTNICICRNGNIHDLRKENWMVTKHPLLQQDFLEEVDSAKKLGQWLQDNGYTSDGQKLLDEIMELTEEKAKETIELLDEAEEILKENGIEIEDENGDEDINE